VMAERLATLYYGVDTIDSPAYSSTPP